MQKAHRKWEREFDRVREANGGVLPQPMPSRWARLQIRYDDEQYFFIVAALQAVSAMDVMRTVDPNFPEISQGKLVRHWRDISEHWDDPHTKGKPIRALDKWREESDDEEPGMTTLNVGDRLVEISGVKLKRLRKDLKRARKLTLAIETTMWEQLYVSTEEAASILGTSVEDVLDSPLMRFPEFEEEGGGLLFWREAVEQYKETGNPQIF